MSWQQPHNLAGPGANLAGGVSQPGAYGHSTTNTTNSHQTNASVPPSSVTNPYSVTLPAGAAGGAGIGAPVGSSAAPAYPPAQQHMHQIGLQQQQQQQQEYLTNLIQQQQMRQQQQLQLQQQQIQVQLQLQQQEQQRRQEQIRLAVMVQAQQQQLRQLQQQQLQQQQAYAIQAQAQVQAHQYHVNHGLSQQVNAQAHSLQRGDGASHNGFQAYQGGDAAVAATIEYSVGASNTVGSVGGGTALEHPDSAPSPSKKRALPTPIGEYGRSQSMPPDIGRRRGKGSDINDDSSENKELSAVEEEERKSVPVATKPRKPPKPMPDTMFRGIIKGGLTKDDIKSESTDPKAHNSQSKANVKKLDGRPPRASSSSSLRRASSLPVSRTDKKEQDRRNQSASASSASASEEEINLMDYLPRRRSRRGNAALAHLAEQIVDGKPIVVITGAGLSVGSGIRPFRGKEGLWSTVVWTKATRESFRDDPLDWYNSFWLPHFPPSTYEGHFHPNEGHEVISKLAALSMADVKVITQNVDGLHSATKQEWDWSERLIEAHGRLGLYKCIPEEDSDTDSDSDEEEDRPVKLGHRKKTRLLREAYYSYGDGAEANKNNETACGDNSSDEEKQKFDEWDRKRKEEAEERATFRPKVSLLGGSVNRGALQTDDGSSSSDDSSSSSSELAVPMKTKGGNGDKEEDAVKPQSSAPDSKSSKARTHNHVICRYELEESFSAAMIDGTERTRRIMLGEIPSDDDDDEDTNMTHRRLTSEESGSDTGMSSGMGSEMDTDVESAKATGKPKRRGSDGGARKVKRRKKRKGPQRTKLLEPPMCPECMIPCPPQALLFDEGYHAHDFYQFEKMEEWLSKAECLIFIGTSFKVTITDVALAHARDHGVPVYNFNVDSKGDGSLESSARLDANNVIGDVGETLPQLWIAVQEEMGMRGLFDEHGEIK